MPPDRSSGRGRYRRTDDPAYESRVQAGILGVASGKYTTLKAAALEENVSTSNTIKSLIISQEASVAARAVRIARDITLKEYNAPLSSLKRKEEFLALAGALEISDDGTISDLTKRIKDHLDTHPELAEQQRFSGLYKAAGSRRQSTQTAVNAPTAGPSNTNRDMYPGPPINSFAYPPAPVPYQLQHGHSFIGQSQHLSSHHPPAYPTAQVATAGPSIQPQFLPHYYNPYYQVPP